MNISSETLRKLPKTDLHLHLDGSLRLETLIELARERNVQLPSYTEEGLCELVFKEKYANLGEYLQGFGYTCSVLQDLDGLERVSYELAWDSIHDGVRYIEVRFAPHLHTANGLSVEQVLTAVNDGLRRAELEYESSDAVKERGEPPFRYGIIACALRMFTAQTPGWYGSFRKLFSEMKEKEIFPIASLELIKEAVRCRDQFGIPIVGFDLAGQEEGYPAKHHREAFQYAHRHFLMKTVHAGEAYGPESIFEAITFLMADRIGHGYHLFSPEKIRTDKVLNSQSYVDSLIRYVANRRITIEVCISSNLQTNPEIGPVQNHHFKHMLANKISTTLCTDNRLVSHTTITKEYQLALDNFSIERQMLRNLVAYGFKRSFFSGPYSEKRAYVRQNIDYFDKVWSDEVGLD